MTQTLVIFWDEFVSNHRDIFEASLRIFNGTIHFIYVTAGDFQQIPPVVKNGKKEEIINALISSSIYWEKFTIFTLTENMRLKTLLTENNVHLYNTQLNYALDLKRLARNETSDNTIVFDEDEDTKKIGMPNLHYFLDSERDLAIRWIYPNAIFNSTIATKSVVLAATNECVDIWNQSIQELNPNVSVLLQSSNEFCEVDDPHGHLKNMINTNVLKKYDVNGIPPAELQLKVGDICIVLRAMMGSGIPSNSRVEILEIHQYVIKAKLLLGNNPIVSIPRIKFKFKLEWGVSYYMMRTQFPLRLAYAMTYNKAQSQTLHTVLLDVTEHPFMHGHLYVAASRVRQVNNIKLFIKKENTHEGTEIYTNTGKRIPVVNNVVYQNILL